VDGCDRSWDAGPFRSPPPRRWPRPASGRVTPRAWRAILAAEPAPGRVPTRPVGGRGWSSRRPLRCVQESEGSAGLLEGQAMSPKVVARLSWSRAVGVEDALSAAPRKRMPVVLERSRPRVGPVAVGVLDELTLDPSPAPETEQKSRVTGQPGPGIGHRQDPAEPGAPVRPATPPVVCARGHRGTVRDLGAISRCAVYRRAARESVPRGGIPAPVRLSGAAHVPPTPPPPTRRPGSAGTWPW